jgi:uncharacterized coiled-coil protein SlyX
MSKERIPGLSQAEWNALPTAVRAYVAVLETQVTTLTAQVKFLTARVAELEAQLSKNSSNSHKPPSSDGPGKVARMQSKRERSGKKPGGQRGHDGDTLRVTAEPDVRIRHKVDRCTRCQQDLSTQEAELIRERQVCGI